MTESEQRFPSGLISVFLSPGKHNNPAKHVPILLERKRQRDFGARLCPALLTRVPPHQWSCPGSLALKNTLGERHHHRCSRAEPCRAQKASQWAQDPHRVHPAPCPSPCHGASGLGASLVPREGRGRSLESLCPCKVVKVSCGRPVPGTCPWGSAPGRGDTCVALLVAGRARQSRGPGLGSAVCMKTVFNSWGP